MIKEIKEEEFQKEVLDFKEKVVVDFYANWCGPCRMLRPVLEEIAKDNKIKFVSIDVDNIEELGTKYGIISIPCLILFQNGDEINRSVGLKSREEIERFIGE